MANRGASYGLSAQVSAKMASKRDPNLEAEVLGWIEACIGQKLPNGSYEDVLRNGIVLCHLMNKLSPGSVKKINQQGSNFQLMENINSFLKAARAYGVPEVDLFQTVDLFERRSIPLVTQCIMALGRTCYLHPEWPGPFLGPKPAEENKRDFSDEVLRAGESIINLQYGTNAGANQSGQNFGNTRHM
ncbi:muscle-specific protein 20-like protein [Leptotrombidium deliense]|uniref:Muscle-specific protein 20-like protein n=1 Tax=Leptotrombidium deliense TaxID=299467 RepID=A0A443S9A7_9ACAR|nr:muscle-specific protein 20-like protein [Leptotrombidium deliense]